MNITYEGSLRCEDDLMGLYRTLGWADLLGLSKERLDVAIANSQKVIYAYDGNMIVGTGRVLTDGALHTYLCGIGVISEYRGRGIGTKIVNLLIKYCESNGLHPQLNTEESLVEYYEKLGFKTFSIGMKK